MTPEEFFGWVAALLTLVAFLQRSMLLLRLAAIGANLSFVIYGLTTGLLPILTLHLTLLPCNLFRLAQLVEYRKRLRQARAPQRDVAPIAAGAQPHTDELEHALQATRRDAQALLHRLDTGTLSDDARALQASVAALEKALHPLALRAAARPARPRRRGRADASFPLPMTDPPARKGAQS